MRKLKVIFNFRKAKPEKGSRPGSKILQRELMADSKKMKIEQKNVTVTNGDNAAGNINKKTINHYGPSSTLKRLSEELNESYASDEDYKGYIEKLEKYLTYAEGQQNVRDLEEKLRAGNREELIQEAKKLKERFSMKISRNQFSDQAQTLFAHILAKINSFFNSKVKTLINEDKPASDIDSLIYDELVTSIYDDVGDCGLDIDTEDIRGMLFYLTGNCHLEWEKNA